MDRDVADLLSRLRVDRLEDDRFEGRTCDVGSVHVYGGQYLGQSVLAAGSTCPGRPIHSLHAMFVHLGDKSLPVRYEVRRIHDGAAFSRRQVTATQRDRVLFEALLSFQVGETGVEHQAPMPELPGHDSLRSESHLRAGFQARLPDRLRDRLPSLWPIDVRPVKPNDPLDPEVGPPHAAWWMRLPPPLPDDALLHAALLAYASDYAFLQAALRPHGLNFLQPQLRIASLDHAMWFLREVRMDQWLLFDTVSPSATSSRVLAQGQVHGADGMLYASIGQEGMARTR